MPAAFTFNGIWVPPVWRYIRPPRNEVRAYCTGIRRCASLKRTINIRLASRIIAKSVTPNLLVSQAKPRSPSIEGYPQTIPAKMIIEIPLPIPYSVINSPNQTRKTVPAIRHMIIVTIPNALVGAITELCCIRTISPQPDSAAKGIIRRWLIRLTLSWPASPSVDILCSAGITGCINCMMIVDVI